MIGDFQAAFRVSRIRRVGIVVWLILLCWGLSEALLDEMRWLAMGLAVMMAIWAWRESHPIIHLSIDADYQAWLIFHHQEMVYEAELLSGSLIYRWVCLLRWRCDGKVYWHMILPDMLDKETFRRLRVWAVFGQKR